jgi:hypothetical protein
MNRRFMLTTSLLVLALLVIMTVEMGSAMFADGATVVRPTAVTGLARLSQAAKVALPQPSPLSHPVVAAGSMSGDFADDHLA